MGLICLYHTDVGHSQVIVIGYVNDETKHQDYITVKILTSFIFATLSWLFRIQKDKKLLIFKILTIMNKVTISQASSSNTEHPNLGFSYLHLLDEEYIKVRKENLYYGEIQLMQFFAKKNQTKFYTAPFEKELDNMIRSSKKTRENNVNVLIPNINRQHGYIRISPPRN